MKLSEVFNKKLSEAYSKYSLWDTYKCQYNKELMFRSNINGSEPRRCFRTKYNRKYIPIGYNFDFTSCEIIHDLIDEAIKSETFKY